MSHTVTITIEDAAYQRLQQRFGDEKIDRVIQRFLQRYTVTDAERAASYDAMAADKEREAEALEWIEFAPDEGFEDWDDDWSWLKPPADPGENDKDRGTLK